MLKAILPLKGKGYMVNLKAFAPQQHWTAMIGYCMKDVKKPHFQTRTHNVPAEELNQGRDIHSVLASSNYADKTRIVLSHKKLIDEVFKFISRALFPIILPAEMVLAHMIQTGKAPLSIYDTN